MRADIRVDADFIGNPKTQRLIRELGPNAIISLLALWGYAARNRPKGILRGLSPGDIAMVARWEGDPKAFVDGLVRLRWLENGVRFTQSTIGKFISPTHTSPRKDPRRPGKPRKQDGKNKGEMMRDACGTNAARMPLILLLILFLLLLLTDAQNPPRPLAIVDRRVRRLYPKTQGGETVPMRIRRSPPS
jgi:hypothetical protein